MDYKITRCPVCGSTSLTPFYDDESSRGGDLRIFIFGIFSLAIEAVRCLLHKNRAYWICNDCGTKFEDNQ